MCGIIWADGTDPGLRLLLGSLGETFLLVEWQPENSLVTLCHHEGTVCLKMKLGPLCSRAERCRVLETAFERLHPATPEAHDP